MKHPPVDEFKSVATIHPDVRPMSRIERLERWATLLERTPEFRLTTLRETEYRSKSSRNALRADNSPISVAFADPVLRVEGLAGDTYGDARRFFDLTHGQMHDTLCNCHFGDTVSADNVARVVRRIIAVGERSGLLGWLGRSVWPLRPAG